LRCQLPELALYRQAKLAGHCPSKAEAEAAIRDTREVWASFFLPQDRARVIELLADLPKRVPDETAFTAALQAVN
jgi:hypothetical protein